MNAQKLRRVPLNCQNGLAAPCGVRYLDNESEEEVDCLSGRLKPLMMSPGSPRRICWDVISAVLIAADAILIPLQLLVDKGDGWMVINWVFRAFWTTDLGMNFLRGYARGDGSVEMSPRKAPKGRRP